MKMLVVTFFTLFAGFANANTTFDLLVLYPNSLVSKYGQSSINAKIGASVAYTNKALQNSGLPYSFRVKHNQRFDLSNSGSVSASLRDQVAKDGTIMNLRNQHKPHVTVYLSEASSSSCGIANFPGGSIHPKTRNYVYSRESALSAVNVTAFNCSTYVMAHEIGHNVGVGHSQRQGHNGFPISTSRGWGVDSSFVTVMPYTSAFSGSTPRITIFSTPSSNMCSGMRCGTGSDNAGSGMNIYMSQYMDRYPACYPVVKKYNRYGSFTGYACGNNVCSNWSSRRGKKICTAWK